MKKIAFTILLAIVSLVAAAQEADSLKPVYSNEYLDTVNVSKKFVLNDYTLIGFQYGISYDQTMFNPRYRQEAFIVPQYYGITYTRYGKMFGYMPYFGFQIGVFFGQDGYKLKEDKETGYIYTLDQNVTQVKMDVIEVPFTAQFHYDMTHFKLLANAGFYGGYRRSITRSGIGSGEIENEFSFKDTDYRIDYGITGGVGFGLVFDPIEFHINAKVKWGWNSYFAPDYVSEYYYRYAYPLDFMLTAGIYFQLTKRTGKTTAALRREAKSIVKSKYEAVDGNN